MKIIKSTTKSANLGSRGFSLVELLVVVGILGILAVAVGVNINSANTRLKSFVFNTKARFNQVRFEAVKRSRNVYLDFDLDDDGNINNGFTIWVDDDGDEAYTSWDIATDDANGNGECDVGEGDCVLSVVTFPADGPEIYAGSASASGGPGDDGPDVKVIGDGVSADSNRFKFRPNGDSRAGTAYFYFPSDGKVAAGPWAIIVNTVGRIRVDEWRSTSGWQSELP